MLRMLVAAESLYSVGRIDDTMDVFTDLTLDQVHTLLASIEQSDPWGIANGAYYIEGPELPDGAGIVTDAIEYLQEQKHAVNPANPLWTTLENALCILYEMLDNLAVNGGNDDATGTY